MEEELSYPNTPQVNLHHNLDYIIPIPSLYVGTVNIIILYIYIYMDGLGFIPTTSFSSDPKGCCLGIHYHIRHSLGRYAGMFWIVLGHS